MAPFSRWRHLICFTAVVAGAGHLSAQSPMVTVGMLSYLQYEYQLNTDSTINGHQNNFDVTRAYINIFAKLGHGVTARVTPDVDARKASSGQLTLRLKYAYAGWHPDESAITFRLGETQTPWLDWEEELWDYRMQGKMALDQGGYMSSSDFGFGVLGNWGGERIDLSAGIYNGETYSGAPGDQRKDAEGRISVRALDTDDSSRVGGLRLTAYGQYGKPTTGGQRYRAVGMVSYRSNNLTLAAEYAWTRDSVTGTAATPAVAPVPETTGRVISIFGVFHVPHSRLALIGRLDSTDPNTANTATNDRLTRIIAGVSYQLSPYLRLLGDIDNTTRQGGNYPNAFNATRSTAYFQSQIAF